jgi:acyl-CoA thioesterase YciA
MNDIDAVPLPRGELALQTIAMPRDTNADGDIFGGWLLSQMDIAGSIAAGSLADGRVATVAVADMAFLAPVQVGSVVRCYTEILETGRSSIRVLVDVWIETRGRAEPQKVTEGEFVFVAIDDRGHTRALKNH